MRSKKNWWWFVAWMGWGLIFVFVVLMAISGYFYAQSAKTGKAEFFGGYQVSWGVFSNQFELSQNGQMLEKFRLPVRPLAVWYRPSTRTAAIVTSEFANGQVSDNQVLYLWKNQVLSKLYHAVVGFDQDQKSWRNSSLYRPDGMVENQVNAVYLTPNEEYLFGREYGYGYSPRVFRVGVNGLISGSRWTFEAQNLHWSPTGQCMINLGTDAQAGWGFFAKPDDFVYYSANSVDVINLRDLQVWWKNEATCEAYVSFVADHFGGEGDTSSVNQTYYYVFGEHQGTKDQIGYRQIKTLPTDVETYQKSLVDDWQLIMVTRP